VSFDTRPPEAHPSITHDVVARLLADQHPELAALELGPRFDGWDSAMFRLGEDLAVRLPRTAGAVRFLIAETHWLPRLCGEWDFPYPLFTAHGVAGHGYPWPWAVVTWVPGETADAVPLTSDQGPALGRALAQVHVPASADAPFNDEQSIPMAARDAKVRERVGLLAMAPGPGGAMLDPAAAMSVWERALAAPETDERVWSHADLHGANVLSHAGEFAGIFDWGSMAACDPAVDLGFAYSLIPAAGMDAVLATYGELTGRSDEAFLARVRGIALAKCVGIAMVDREVTRHMGWRGLDALGLLH